MGRWCPNGQICGRASVSKLTYGETSNFSCVGLKENPLNQSHVWRLCCHQKMPKEKSKYSLPSPAQKETSFYFPTFPYHPSFIYISHPRLLFSLFPIESGASPGGNPRLTSSSAGSPLSRFLSHYFNIQVGNPAKPQWKWDGDWMNVGRSSKLRMNFWGGWIWWRLGYMDIIWVVWWCTETWSIIHLRVFGWDWVSSTTSSTNF